MKVRYDTFIYLSFMTKIAIFTFFLRNNGPFNGTVVGLLIIIQMGIKAMSSTSLFPLPCDHKIRKGTKSLIFFEEFYHIF